MAEGCVWWSGIPDHMSERSDSFMRVFLYACMCVCECVCVCTKKEVIKYSPTSESVLYACLRACVCLYAFVSMSVFLIVHELNAERAVCVCVCVCVCLCLCVCVRAYISDFLYFCV